MSQIKNIPKFYFYIEANEFAKNIIRELIMNDSEIKMMRVSYEEFEKLLKTLQSTGDVRSYQITKK